MVETKSTKRYEKIKHLGEGQFANVYKAKDNVTGEVVAIKKIKLGSRHEAKDGINRTALREIKLLKEIHHENIISLRDVIGNKSSISLVFDFMETDLEHLIKDTTIILSSPHIKNIMMQTFLGLNFLHANFILHRDLKPNNLLMNNMGRVKITDFGLARFFGSPSRVYTHQVVTRWYRSPELLYAAKSYGVNVDIWAMGCIFAELLLRNPIFPGESDLDQLVKIYRFLGTPTEDDWALMKQLPDYVEFTENYPRMDFKAVFTAAGDSAIDLLERMFEFDPLKRWNTDQCLGSMYFQIEPYACDDSELPLPNKNQNASKRRRILRDGPESPPRRRLVFD
ncbi:unnamed protein product, partial [Mesorhabditis belari]|uniref:Cyclin-dependent kinase 7 n=1 Tax=Mesorhabditis belari TaxID=2138241 RepID=A0AAF3FFZ3_9BILA